MQQEFCDEYVKQFPLTMRIERLLRQFESGHHAVSVVEGITSDLIGCGESTKMTFLTQDQFKRTEKGLIVLIYSMICQFFPEIALIENATRMKFLQRFYDQFVPIYRAEMTVGIFIISAIHIRSVWVLCNVAPALEPAIFGAALCWLRVDVH
uniref:Uncharacterized protein n=1 Tax=Meloidogyne enterolobii TaxID=390850 RepID=A0A6V7WVT2_MELEN|nr:unnamed protein product [Meloidogyne enterolobii]